MVSSQDSADIDIERIVVEVKQLADRNQLVVVPTMPTWGRDPGFLAVLDSDEMSAADFCALAVAANTRLFYIQADPFSVEKDVELNKRDHYGVIYDDGANTQLLAMREESAAFEGRIGELALGFAADGVLHYWTVTAAWYDNLQGQMEETVSDMGGERLRRGSSGAHCKACSGTH
jgi:hypothetical protein